jgi:hypothetical protein
MIHKHDNLVKLLNNDLIKKLIVIFLLLMVPNSLAAEVIVSTPGATVQTGKTFDININIDPMNMPVSGAQLNIQFDQSILKVNKVIEGDFFKQNRAKTYFHKGIIKNSSGLVENIFSVILGQSNVSGPGTFLIINATAIGSSNFSWINLSDVKISDTDGRSVLLKSINGTLNISKIVESNDPIDLPASVSPTSGYVNKGESISMTFYPGVLTDSGTVSLSAAGLPSGVSATFSPQKCNPSCSYILMFSTSPTTPSGTYQIIITYTNGINKKSKTYSLTVKSPPSYSAKFSQTGVAGTWGVTVNGIRYATSSLSIEVPGLSGKAEYSYDKVVNSGTDTRYSCTSECTGSFNSSTSVSASYNKQYLVTTSASPVIGGTVVPSSGWFDAGSSVSITASSASGYLFSTWSGIGTGSYSGTLNPFTITINSPVNESAIFDISPVTSSLAEALDNDLVWTTGGNGKWSAQNKISFYGNDAAVSEDISNNDNTWIQTTVTGPGSLKFYWKLSSEKYFDSFFFFMDGNLVGLINGEVDWQEKSYNIGAGTHILRWYYFKNSITSERMDRAWLDNVQFYPS